MPKGALDTYQQVPDNLGIWIY